MKKIFVFFVLAQVLLAKVLIQGAMTSETDVLINSLEDKKEEKFGSYLFYTGKIKGVDVVVSKTLIGITNAASSTTIGILKYNPTLIINQGTAGGHNLDLNVGDIVLGEKIYNSGAYYTEYSDDKIDPYAKKPMQAPLTLLDKDNNDAKSKYFTSSKDMLDKAYKFFKSSNTKAIKGTIVTADAYNKETKMIELLRKTYNSDAEEMESVAVAQVAKAFDVPFLSIRIISNIEPKKLSFDEKTAIKCQELVIEFLEKELKK